MEKKSILKESDQSVPYITQYFVKGFLIAEKMRTQGIPEKMIVEHNEMWMKKAPN